MKKLIPLLVIPIQLVAQIFIDFNNNDLEQWTGDTNHYQIDSLFQLKLVAPYQSSTSTIFYPSTAILNGNWEIDVNMDFNPSSSNYCQLFLSIDENQNGYFIRLGGTDDEVSLYKTNNGQNSKLIDGVNDFLDVDSVNVKIKVERDSLGNWELWTQHYEQEAILQGICFDNTFVNSQSIGIQSTYTSTRSQKFFYDNLLVSGKSFLDTFARPKVNDIDINEVLFNPVDGDNDFVEIKNISGHRLNIKPLLLGNYCGGRPDNFKAITLDYLFMENDEIIVLTKSISDLLYYHPKAIESQIIELISLPSYNNDEGIVVLLSDSIIIDEFNYHESMHFPFLKSKEGVSLERINTQIATNRADNWQSASETSGFSTPTLKNSQSILLSNRTESLSISPKVFSPNNNGIDDNLRFNLTFSVSGYIGQLLIFNDEGKLVNTIVNNEFLGTENTFFWNGIDQYGQKSKIGRYIVLLEAYHQSAQPIIEKTTFVIGP
ncbi:MAG: hypothetical protein ACON4D_03065 [Flavobacteriales bacterium]